MKNKLKPCPFCKGEAGDHDYGQEYWCKCQSCLAEGPKTSSRDTADFLWNMRPSISDAAPYLLEALVESRQVIATALKVGAPDWFDTDEKVAEHTTVKKIDAAISKATA